MKKEKFIIKLSIYNMRALLILFFLQLFLTTSCASQNLNLPYGARETFVKIEKTINIFSCDEETGEHCQINSAMITGSGVVIANKKEGSYILTAAHVCDSNDIMKRPGIKEYQIIIEAVTLEEKKYLSNIVNMNFESDVCILFAKGLKNKVAKISRKPPKQGERVFNVAAPVGIFYKNTVPILDGFFMGDLPERTCAYYSIPASGGSSGSPIFNSYGYLVGMIHSVNVYFPMISVSPIHKNMIDFIKTTIIKEMTPN